MKNNIAKINCATLKYIRESTKASFDYIEKKTQYTRDRILAWEDDTNPDCPTLNQAKELAACLHVPFAGLYMEAKNIPDNQLPNLRNMRKIQLGFINDDSALNLAIIDIIRERSLYLDICNQLDMQIPIFDLNVSGEDVYRWADRIKNYFTIALSEQYACSSARQFYLYLKGKVEKKGIFIQSFTGVEVEEARGIAITDNILPIIGINEKDFYPAKSFSIIHEIVHIIKRQSTLCNDLYSNFEMSQEEVFCNAVAGEVLAPKDAITILVKEIKEEGFSLSNIDILAKKLSVSKEVVIRRLLDLDHINRSEYDTFTNEIKQKLDEEKSIEREKRKEQNTGFFPKPALKAADRNSSALCNGISLGINENIISRYEASRYLGVNVKYLDNVLKEVWKWSN